jgi:6-phosphogluconolactonase
MADKKFIAYIGTYTYGESKGIYKFVLNEDNCCIEDIQLVGKLCYPTYLAINKNNTYLYSVIKDGETGGLASFKIDTNTYKLQPLNYNFTKGKSPCHIILDKSNNYAFTSNYHKGELISYKLSPDGSIENSLDKIIHTGFGPNKLRQDSSHIHFADFTPDGNYLCTVDLGLDKLSVYEFKEGTLIESIEKNLNFKPGCGPRHIVFHPNGHFAYILTELSSEVITLKYDKFKSLFVDIQYISALPLNCSIESAGGAIHISSDGKYLYTSNRGHDSITVFSVDSISGKLEFLSNTMLKGQVPRDFSISPSGNFLIVANQYTSNLELYSINNGTGALTYLNVSEYIPNPVCIKFLN